MSIVISHPFSILDINLGHFEAMAHIHGKTTQLNWRDKARANLFVAQVRHLMATQGEVPGVLCMSEVWSRKRASWFVRQFSKTHPYVVPLNDKAFGVGLSAVPKAIDQGGFLWRPFARHIEKYPRKVIAQLAKADRGIRGAENLKIGHKVAVGALEKVLEGQIFMGAGLLFLSRYPLMGYASTTYDAHTGFEKYIRKGIVQATLEVAVGCRVTVFFTHLQEGVSDEARAARLGQLKQLKSEIDGIRETHGSDWPIVVVGDFNIIGNVDKLEEASKTALKRELTKVEKKSFDLMRKEYQMMIDILDMVDSMPDGTGTYRQDNPVARALKTHSRGPDLRIDYGLYSQSERMSLVKAAVLKGHPWASIADHNPCYRKFLIT